MLNGQAMNTNFIVSLVWLHLGSNPRSTALEYKQTLTQQSYNYSQRRVVKHFYVLNFSQIVRYFFIWHSLDGLWCLTPLSTIYQLYWLSVLLVEETGVPRENHWPVASHWQTCCVECKTTFKTLHCVQN
jgi:hypothetical protein